MADAALSFPRFRSRLPWWGRDLQTLRNHIVGIESSLAPYPAERVEFPMTDATGSWRACIAPPRIWAGPWWY